MKKSTKKLLLTIFSAVILIVCFAITSFAAQADIYDSLKFKANADDDNTVVATQIARDGARYLFLPSSADIKNLVLYFDNAENVTFSTTNGSVKVISGQSFDLTALFTKATDEYKVTVTADGTTSSLTIMKSENVRALFYVSDDPVNKGRPWVDKSKSNEAEGNMSIVGLEGAVDYTDEVTEFKGRGNSTFAQFSKKPYQMKIANKTSLIEGADKNKKWVLLANAADNSFLHNIVVFTIAEKAGLAYTTPYEPVDLYFDGEYRGHYLITEKVEVDKARINIDDLDSRIEEANEDTDAYENPVVVTKTIESKGTATANKNSSGSYKYVQGLTEPELPDGANHHAYLLELELTARYPSEQSGFVSKKGQAVVTKNPEYLTKDTGAFISNFWQEFEDAVYSANGYNTKTGKYYYEYCDLESLVNLYLINELGKNVDGFRSSTYFYMPEDEDIMYAGPVWDYDRCFGVGNGEEEKAHITNPENFFATKMYLVDALIKIESFRDAVKETLNPETGKFYNAAMSVVGNNGTITKEGARLNQQQKLNFKIWDFNYSYLVVLPGDAKTYENSVEFLNYFVEKRISWLSDTTSEWNGDDYSLPTDDNNPEENLSFFERIIQSIVDFFNTIIDFFKSLFGL